MSIKTLSVVSLIVEKFSSTDQSWKIMWKRSIWAWQRSTSVKTVTILASGLHLLWDTGVSIQETKNCVNIANIHVLPIICWGNTWKANTAKLNMIADSVMWKQEQGEWWNFTWRKCTREFGFIASFAATKPPLPTIWKHTSRGLTIKLSLSAPFVISRTLRKVELYCMRGGHTEILLHSKLLLLWNLRLFNEKMYLRRLLSFRNFRYKGRPPIKKNVYFRVLPESGGGREGTARFFLFYPFLRYD